jgi:outer membrane protein assembly factor BamB
MKIQCSCGAKYAFDLTPEMAREPVKFICPQCGRDSSELVNQLIRQELAGQAVPPVPPPPPASVPPPRPAPARLKIAREEAPAGPAAAPPAEEPAAANEASKYCQKHRGVLATEKCTVCGKPICPQCLEVFGFFCSPLCRNKAEQQGIDAPVYAGDRFAVDKQYWNKVSWVCGPLLALVVLFFGVWFWYAWFGSVPHNYFSVHFGDDNAGYAGGSQLVAPDQIVFLHGGTLARYDLKTQKPVWSLDLVSPDQINAIVKAENDERTREQNQGDHPPIPLPVAQARVAKISLQLGLSLYVFGQNIWVSQPDKLVHYNWDSGKVMQEIPLSGETDAVTVHGDELLLFSEGNLSHINPATGETRMESFSGADGLAAAGHADNGVNNSTGGGLLSTDGRPLDPSKVADQAQNLKTPGLIALPALLGNAAYEQQLEAALRDDDPHRRQNSSALPTPTDISLLVPGDNGFVQLSVRLLQRNIVAREAMRAAPKKSVLDNPNLNASQTADVANEMLNEKQRDSGNDKVTENDSRYQVTVHLPGSPSTTDWTGEVVGPPQLFSLKTVNVVAAGKTIIVLDQSNKKLWEASLTYNLPAGPDGGPAPPSSLYGAGPCVEHDGTLYVFDQAVLTAFDLNTGNARWRVPTVGTVGLFFDNAGNVYVNTTTGNPDDIKYARQIDINKSTAAVLMKMDPATGKILWNVKPGGFVSYLSGKFIYTVQSYDPNPHDEEALSDSLEGLQKPPYLRITRINPANGRTMWDYERDSCPVTVEFDQNKIELVFKHSVQVLKYLSL